MINCTFNYKDKLTEIIKLFGDTFSDSEGEQEGKMLTKLVSDMFTETSDGDIRVYLAYEDEQHEKGEIIGAVIFTRLTYPDDPRKVFILSPMAVKTDHQGKKIGQKLLTFALDSLRNEGVDISITYGDINFYSKVGFHQITEDLAKAPQPLSFPHGWLGQCLTETTFPFSPLVGSAQCVKALDDPSYW